MGDAVIAQRLDDRVTTDDFARKTRQPGRRCKPLPHRWPALHAGWQAADELSGQVDGLFAFGVTCTVACFLGIEA